MKVSCVGDTILKNIFKTSISFTVYWVQEEGQNIHEYYKLIFRVNRIDCNYNSRRGYRTKEMIIIFYTSEPVNPVFTLQKPYISRR